jgi:hypothetical protein
MGRKVLGLLTGNGGFALLVMAGGLAVWRHQRRCPETREMAPDLGFS